MIFLPHIITVTDGYEYNTELVSYDMIKNRIIYLNGEVNSESALSVITQLRYLAAKSDRDIFMYINSPGGSVSDGLAIYDMINQISCDVVTIATGVAASMGAFLVAAGTPGKRFATPSVEIMIHQPLGGVQGQATDISLVAEHIQRLKRRLGTILADKCKKSSDSVIADMERDCWMSAIQAKNYGLIDHIGFPELI